MTFEEEKRAYEIYLHASELVEPERSAWLASLSLEEEVLDEISGLLAVDSDDASIRLNGLTGALRALHVGIATGEELIGVTLGPYLIEELVRDTSGKHKGGMGFVYKARRNDGAGDRIVAIKVVQWPHSAHRERELFLRERRNLFKLTHPNIVQIIDAGTVPDGRPYYVMEWVEGGADFTDYCEQRNLPVRDRVELFQSVCSAVKRAHSSGVIHKDLKPSNIQVDRDGVPKLLDFGLSSQLDEETTENLSRSILTPAYASPEQLKCEALTVSSDIYSLGLVLRETLGNQGLDDAAPPESWRNKSSLADLEMRSVVSKMLAHNPADRYQTVDAVEKDLSAWLSGKVVESHRGTAKSEAVYVAQKFVRRNLLGVSLSALAVLVLVFGFISITRERNEALRQRTNAVSGQLAAIAQVQIDAGDIATGGILAAESLRRRESFEGNQAARKALRYLPDRIWVKKLSSAPTKLRFSSDGNYISLSYEREGKVEVRKSSGGELVLAALHRPPEGCEGCGQTNVAFDPNRPECATSGMDGVIRIWDLQTTKLVREFRSNEPGLREVEYWNNDVLAASIDQDRAGLFDTKTGKLLFSAYTGGELPELSSDGKVFVVNTPLMGDSVFPALHDARSFSYITAIRDGFITQIRVNPKRPEAAALLGGGGGALRLAFIDIGAQEKPKLVLGPETFVETPDRLSDLSRLNLGRRKPPGRLRFSRDGRHLFVYDDKRLYLVDALEKKILKVWPRDSFSEGGVEGSTYLQWLGLNGARLYTLPDLQLESVVQMPLQSTALAPSGRSFVTAQYSGELEFWTPHHFTDELNDGDVIHAAFSPDSRYMASINKSGTFAVRLTQSDTIAYRERMEPPSSHAASGVAFSPDGKYVTLRLNTRTHLYETGSWKRLAQSPERSGSGPWIEYPFAASEFLDNGKWLQQSVPSRTVVFSVPGLKPVYEAEEHAFVAAITSNFAVIFRSRREAKSSEVEVVSLPAWTVVRRLGIPGREIETCAIGKNAIACSIINDDRPEEGQVRSVGGVRLVHDRSKSPKIGVWSLDGRRSETTDISLAVAVLKITLADERMTVISRDSQTDGISNIEFSMWPLRVIRRRAAPRLEPSFPIRLTAEVEKTTDVLGFSARLLRYKAGVAVETKLIEQVADREQVRLYVSDDERFAALALSDGFFRLEPLRGADLIERLCRKLEFNLNKSDWGRFLPDEPYRATCSGLPQRTSQ